VELKLERCTIRDWRMEDAESLAKHANNRNVSRNLRDRFSYPYTIENGKEFLQRATNQNAHEKSCCIEIDGLAVGGIGFKAGEDVHRHTGEIGYWIGEEFWGRGIMTDVVSAVVDYCFEEFSSQRIFAKTFSNNPASARVLEKAGFVFEGRLRKDTIKDGQILDSLLYAKTK
jgi:RimJ/RimL family protein N-acetyltransferase